MCEAGRESKTVYSPVVPTDGGKVLVPASDTALRSGSGRLRLGKLGSGGKPAGRGIRPTTTHTHKCHMRVYCHYSFIFFKLPVPYLHETCAALLQ